MFEVLELAPPDAILGLNEAFQKDSNPDKINLGVGVYKDESGITPILNCVKKAERILLEEQKSKAYLGIDGIKEYGRLSRELLFGPDHKFLTADRAVSIQAPGGTGALRVAGDFLHTHFPASTVWCSTPTWANHPKVFEAAGLNVKSYTYFCPDTNGLNFEGLLNDLKQIPERDIVLLHGCCHNPCGVDPTVEQWKEIADVVKQRNALPLVDFAYQGFAEGVDADAAGLRVLAESLDEMLVASSYSKNFGLYCERVGVLTAVGKDASSAEVILSQLKTTVRTNYSNPPSHGAAVVSSILADASLRTEWESEVAAMRDRIASMRKLFVAKMAEHAPDRDFSFIQNQNGMFSFSGLTPDQVKRLKEEFSIYIVGSGRINVAGITSSNVDRLCKSIAACL
ncbi:MAG: aspartate/tyrosine/aromatic aminotransferase [Planctomycetales bacterium]|nr:aspartate/tyrosine/aromatic aminotransferase [Planctomycetales bacterium]